VGKDSSRVCSGVLEDEKGVLKDGGKVRLLRVAGCIE
jgi:hypothetical protein